MRYNIVDITEDITIIDDHNLSKIDYSLIPLLKETFTTDLVYEDYIIEADTVDDAVREYLSENYDTMRETINGCESDTIVVLVYDGQTFIEAYSLTLIVSIDENVNKIKL